MTLAFKSKILAATLVLGSLFATTAAWAQVDLDAVKQAINAKWAKSMSTLPAITEIRETPITGLFEVVVGGEVLYTDRQGDYLVLGEMLEIKAQRNLTQERTNSLIQAVDFDKLPFENAIVIKRGDGSRKLVVFEDPNCGYCHKFEQQLLAVDNVTVYVFLYPILSADSHVVSKNIWCAANPIEAWQNWMVRQISPAEATCDVSAINKNVAIGQQYGIRGTPTLIFADGSRIPGAVGPEAVEAKLKELGSK